MKKTFIYLSILIGICVLPIVSCHHDNTITPIITPSNIVEITANIENVTTWETGKIYVIKKWDFYVDNTLTIQPGVIIKFHPTLGPNLTLGGTGTILANGTAASPIIFTSFKDDANGGDTNGDGTATTAAKADWGTINTNGLNSSVFNHCNFFFSGMSQYAALAITSSSNATVTNCLFAHNDGFYGDEGALSAADAGSATIIRNNIFYDNVKPLSVNTLFSLDSSNVFHNPNSPTQTNTYNDIFIESINEIATPITYLETEVAFIINDNDLWISSTLTLGNNVVIKFKPASTIVLNNGATSSIINYNGTGVVFTSYKDDSLKGDSNADGTATSPAANDWGGIYDNGTSVYMTWANIHYDSY